MADIDGGRRQGCGDFIKYGEVFLSNILTRIFEYCVYGFRFRIPIVPCSVAKRNGHIYEKRYLVVPKGSEEEYLL